MAEVGAEERGSLGGSAEGSLEGVLGVIRGARRGIYEQAFVKWERRGWCGGGSRRGGEVVGGEVEGSLKGTLGAPGVPFKACWFAQRS